jgi:hypothetical protein
MDVTDLSKARAYAGYLDDGLSKDWIHTLANEVESLTAQLATAQQSASTATAERDAAVAGLQDLYAGVAAMLREARHVADNHPDPAASGAALRILGSAS